MIKKLKIEVARNCKRALHNTLGDVELGITKVDSCLHQWNQDLDFRKKKLNSKHYYCSQQKTNGMKWINIH